MSGSLSNNTGRIIDCHVHVFPEEFRERRESLCRRDPGFNSIYGDPRAKMATPDEVLDQLRQVGGQAAVVFGFPWRDPGLCRAHNDYIAQLSVSQDKGLVGMGCVSPAMGRRGLREAARCLEMGLRGIGEVALYDSRGSLFNHFFRSLAELLAWHGLPLVLHVTECVGHNYPGKDRTDLEELYRWISANPELDLVLAHWGGGVLFYELMPEVRRAFKRVRYDTAASPFLYSPDIYKVAVSILGPSKVMFGSDFPLIHQGRYIKEMEAAKIPRRALRGILGENAARLWKIHLADRKEAP
jgi:predicted TIM-barrel fold metal-dependent hydrolase